METSNFLPNRNSPTSVDDTGVVPGTDVTSQPTSSSSSDSNYPEEPLHLLDYSDDSAGSAYASAIATTDNYYGYGPAGNDHDIPPLPPPPLMSDSGMTPERQARKQRMRPSSSARRGGACHSELLKSAVLATLESYDDPDSGDEFHSSSIASGMDRSERSMPSSMDDNSRSSRKRARQNFAPNGGDDEDDENNNNQNVVDDCLLSAMDVCSISTARMMHHHPNHHHSHQQHPQLQHQHQPVRHVVRRTSRELAYARRTKEQHVLTRDSTANTAEATM